MSYENMQTVRRGKRRIPPPSPKDHATQVAERSAKARRELPAMLEALAEAKSNRRLTRLVAR